MKLTAEADLLVGVTVGSGKKRLGFGFGIGRRKVVKRIGIDLEEELLRRFCLFYLKDSDVLSWNWSSLTKNSIHVDRDRAMKRSNVFNLLLQMMPSSAQASSASPDHWDFLEEVDAPQWADLVKEAALMGTLGDDPWFHRSHSHHETSLARVENVPFAGRASSIEKPEQPTKRKVVQVKGTVSKLIKPSLKANAMKACLGGTQRFSNAGSKEGRLSPRPRVTSQPRPRTPKVYIQHPEILKKATPAVVTGSDSRRVACEPLSNAGTRKISHERHIGNLRRIDPTLNAQDAQKTEFAGIGRNIRSVDRSPTRPGCVIQSSEPSVTPPSRCSLSNDPSANVYESPNPSMRLYRLPSPPDGPKSSPSDMTFSSDESPTSSSSKESRRPTDASSAASLCKRKILTSDESVKERSKLQPDVSLEISSASPSANCTDIEVNEPFLEVSAFKVLDRDLSNGYGRGTSVHSPNWKRASNPRLKRRSLGPPLRVKQIEKVGSSSVKKKGSSKVIDRQDARQPGKVIGTQATHPILEKLRKSWGSALRIKQRQDEDTRNDNGRQKSCDIDQTVGSVLYSNNSGNLRSRKLDKVQVQSEVVRRGQPGGAAIQSSELRVFVKDTTARERQFIYQQPAAEIQVLNSPRSIGSSVPASGILSKSKSMGTTDTKTSTPPPAKVGLAKIQQNNPRAKPDIPSKFKKQYAHAETGISKSLSMKANKENMHSEVRCSAPGLERKRKMQNVVPRSIMSTNTRQLGPAVGIPPASLTVNVIRSPQAGRTSAQTRTNPQAGNVITSKAGLGYRSTRTPGQEATLSSAQKSEPIDKKLNNAVLPGSTSSLLRPTKQKSEKISSTLAKEAATKAGPKGCKSVVKVADESLAIAAEERKSRPAPIYEPRLHSVKAIKEVPEIDSGLKGCTLAVSLISAIKKSTSFTPLRKLSANGSGKVSLGDDTTISNPVNDRRSIRRLPPPRRQ